MTAAEPPRRDATIRSAARRLDEAGIETPLREARLLFQAATGLTPEDVIRDPAEPVTQQQAATFEAYVTRRATREPFARITGSREFHGLEFQLSQGTLIPRPDTETLVDAVIDTVHAAGKGAAALSILDLGTGTGAILAALLAALPNARGLGVDQSADAVATATTNLTTHAPGRAVIRLGDWFQGLSGTFDLIVSNPPYIPSGEIAGLDPEVAQGDPSLALDGGADGLDCYRAIAAGVRAHLAAGGLVAVEIGAGQADDVAHIFERHGLTCTHRARDLGGHLRALLFRFAP